MKISFKTTNKILYLHVATLDPRRLINVIDISFLLLRLRIYWPLSEEDARLREQFHRNWYRLTERDYKISSEDLDFVIWMGRRFGESEITRLWRCGIIDGDLMLVASRVVIYDKSWFKWYYEKKKMLKGLA